MEVYNRQLLLTFISFQYVLLAECNKDNVAKASSNNHMTRVCVCKTVFPYVCVHLCISHPENKEL